MIKSLLFLFIFSLTMPLWAHKLGAHTYHESKMSAQDPEPQVPLSPFCDFNINGTIDPEEIYGVTETNTAITINPNTTENAQKMIQQCAQKRIEEADETGGGLFGSSPITPGKLNFQPGELALTVDDGPSSGITDEVLRVLAQYNIKATFFIVGNRIKKNAALVAKMIRAGHIIGNHTLDHTVSTDPNLILNQILKGHDAFVSFLKSPSGQGVLMDGDFPRFQNFLYRAPGLAWKQAVALTLNANEITQQLIGPIHANIGTDAPVADWSCWSKGVSPNTCAEWYYKDILQKGRGIILSHDINAKTPKMLEHLLLLLHTKGGGIKNLDPKGAWNFVRIDNRRELKNLEGHGHDEFIKMIGQESP